MNKKLIEAGLSQQKKLIEAGRPLLKHEVTFTHMCNLNKDKKQIHDRSLT